MSRYIPHVTNPISRGNLLNEHQSIKHELVRLNQAISGSSKDGEVIMARSGHDSLSARLDHMYTVLPVVTYSGYESVSESEKESLTLGRITLWHQGKMFTRTNLTFTRDQTGGVFAYLVWSGDEFEVVPEIRANDLPLYLVKNGHDLWPLIGLYDFDFNYLYFDKGELKDKQLFTWVADRTTSRTNLIMRDMTKIENCYIDMRGLPFKVLIKTQGYISIYQSEVTNFIRPGTVIGSGQENDNIKISGSSNHLKDISTSGENYLYFSGGSNNRIDISITNNGYKKNYNPNVMVIYFRNIFYVPSDNRSVNLLADPNHKFYSNKSGIYIYISYSLRYKCKRKKEKIFAPIVYESFYKEENGNYFKGYLNYGVKQKLVNRSHSRRYRSRDHYTITEEGSVDMFATLIRNGKYNGRIIFWFEKTDGQWKSIRVTKYELL